MSGSGLGAKLLDPLAWQRWSLLASSSGELKPLASRHKAGSQEKTRTMLSQNVILRACRYALHADWTDPVSSSGAEDTGMAAETCCLTYRTANTRVSVSLPHSIPRSCQLASGNSHRLNPSTSRERRLGVQKLSQACWLDLHVSTIIISSRL